MQILRAHQSPTHGNDDLRVRRVRPGVIAEPFADPAFGPLSAIDHAHLSIGMVVEMHEHKNDGIHSYVLRGTSVHEDSVGHRAAVSADELMMNAGESFRHDESADDEPVEGLQIFARPREADLPVAVSFFDCADGPSEGIWSLVAGRGQRCAVEVPQRRLALVVAAWLRGARLTDQRPLRHIRHGPRRLHGDLRLPTR
ncbi:pirin family protein [Microvirga vignae]|uniref:pirin family protein n=1 Tax=Microvirga vignae TaxID=1225564 RepID=UPI000A0034CA|nr:pirin family protein [Microvirga vignae]